MSKDDSDQNQKKLLAAAQGLLDKMKKRKAWIDQIPHPAYSSIVQTYASYDFWDLKAGLNLLANCHPENDASNGGASIHYTLAKNCIGPDGTLKVEDHKAPWRKHRVKPKDLLKWALEKDVPIPSEIKDALPLNKSNKRPSVSSGIKQLVRDIADTKWKENPSITKVNMALDPEIQIFAGSYTQRRVEDWIADLNPDRSPGRRPK